jgi:fumarate reductase flavoprotein subunit
VSVKRLDKENFEISYPVVIIGGGACGMCAALAARDSGVETLILERDKTPLGTTAMSTGLIPAAGTPDQATKNIDDCPERLVADILAKTKGKTDEAIVRRLAQESADTVAWLREKHGVRLSLVEGFLYPGHTAMRMYGMPNRSGSELMSALSEAVIKSGTDILTRALAKDLFVDAHDVIVGVSVERPDGQTEVIGCENLILACCGFAGDPKLVEKYTPEMTKAVFHGHPGNKGDAILWGEALGAKLADMTAYQGHGGLAAGHGIPILWPIIVEGGFQINTNGKRFSDESLGYSEQAVKVLEQPGSVAWTVYDARLHKLMQSFDDYRDALKADAIIEAPTIRALAKKMRTPADVLEQTFADVAAFVAGVRTDVFGRDFVGKPQLTSPFYAAKVTGALFHTQGGLVVDENARVIHQDGIPFPNLFAGGGAARGVSGPGADGYMAGNGLLTATTFGKLAGRAAAMRVNGD